MLPDRSYLALLGELAYRVSYLEALVIGDLGSVLPASINLDLSGLLGRTTAQIGDAVSSAAKGWGDAPKMQSFGVLAGEALKDVSERRNHVLHARPATSDTGQQVLLRDRYLRNGRRDLFWVDESYLREQVAAVEEWTIRLQEVRLAGP